MDDEEWHWDFGVELAAGLAWVEGDAADGWVGDGGICRLEGLEGACCAVGMAVYGEVVEIQAFCPCRQGVAFFARVGLEDFPAVAGVDKL